MRVLVFHRAEGYVHRSIPDAVAAVVALGDRAGFDADATDDPDVFAGDIDRYDVSLFVHTSGDVLPEPGQRRGLERFVTGGGGFVGVHAAAAMGDVADEWPWYRDLVGAAFKGHTVARLYCDEPFDSGPGAVHAGPCSAAPAHAEWVGEGLAMDSCEPAVLHVEDPACEAVAGLVDGERRVDEWYGFHRNPRTGVQVLATVDESTYEPHLGAMGEDHPVIWWHDVGRGRAVYNSLGHASATWRDESFLAAIAGAITFARRR